MRRPSVHPYLSPDLHKRFKDYCAQKGATESSVVEAALREYLDGVGDVTLIRRRLDRLGRALLRLQRDVDIQTEAFGAFVRLWLAHTPEVPPDAQKTVSHDAMARYARFLDHVARQFKGGRHFIDNLVHEPPLEPTDAEADRAQAFEDNVAPPPPLETLPDIEASDSLGPGGVEETTAKE